jgi:hypothetical protein
MYAAGMGHSQTVTLLLCRGADPTSCNPSGRTFVHYAIARGHFDLVLEALDTILEQYGIEALQAMSEIAILVTISHGRQHFRGSRAPFFSKLVENLADVNILFRDSHHGVDGNSLLHYALSVEEGSALVRCGFRLFNEEYSAGKLAINSLTLCPDPALIKLCIENGTEIRHKDGDARTVLFDLFFNSHFSAGSDPRRTLAAIRLCLDAGIDIFETDSCRCACSPDGCTVSSVFLVDFPSTWSESRRPGFPWSLEWVTLVEEHRGVEAARQVLLSLLRRAKCHEFDIDITHTCCHRGRAIHAPRWRGFEHRPIPLADEAIIEIQDEERGLICILEGEMKELASRTLDYLRSEWISVIKAKFSAHVAAVEESRAKSSTQPSEVWSSIVPPDMGINHASGLMEALFQSRSGFHVDYRNDTYEHGVYVSDKRPMYQITRAIGSYAFWLQYEYANTDNSSLPGEVRREGWFERRVSWLKELVGVMALPADEITAEARRICKEQFLRKEDCQSCNDRRFCQSCKGCKNCDVDLGCLARP